MPKLSAEALRARISALQKQLTAAENSKGPAVRQVRALMRKLRVTMYDLADSSAGNTSSAPKARRSYKGSIKGSQKVAVRYRDPNGNTWTGRGKTPRWMVDAEKAGKKREEYLIQAN
jgi:DNA-binding protein H-NS